MRSLKYYSEDLYVKKLKEIDFPDHSNFKDINEAYSDFTEKVASVIDEIAPIKEVRVKSNSQDWFDAEINQEIERRDKLLAKFKKSRSTLYNVCSVHRGVFSTSGGYHEYLGRIS